jgi:hypothetical protein
LAIPILESSGCVHCPVPVVQETNVNNSDEGPELKSAWNAGRSAEDDHRVQALFCEELIHVLAVEAHAAVQA